MKLHLRFTSLFVVLYAFSTTCFAQNIAVALDKMNVFYVGIDNPLTIVASNCPCSRISVTTNNGRLTGSGCIYIINPDQPGAAYISVFEKRGTKLKKLGTNGYRVKMVPRPSFRIGPYGSGLVKKAVIAMQQFVRADLDNFDFDAHFRIDSFNVTIMRDSLEIKKFHNASNRLSPEILDAFSLLKKNDLIIFDEIFLQPNPLFAAYIDLTYDEDGTPHFNKTAVSDKNKIGLELDPVTLKVYE